MAEEYSDHFRQVHALHAPTIHIHRFAARVNPQAMGLTSKMDFFAPVRFSIHVTSDANGIVRMDVPVHANPNWIADLKTRLAATLSIPIDKSIEVRTVTGKPLEKVDVRNLGRVGKLNVYVNGRLKRCDKMPAVPTEYSVTKRLELHSWHTNAVRDLPGKISDELHQKNSAQVNAAIRPDGSVMKIISQHIATQAEGGWPEFVRVHHVNSPVKLKDGDAEAALHKVSMAMFSRVRSFVHASKEQIGLYIANMENKEVDPALGKHFAPVLGEQSGKKRSFLFNLAANAPKGRSLGRNVNGREMYSRLAEDALCGPALKRSIVHTLYQAPMASSQKRQTKLVPLRQVATHHPWYAQIHHTLLPMRGNFPANYMTGHRKRDMSSHAPYVKGDLIKTYQAYHLYSGQHLAPPALLLVGCGHAMKKKKKKTDEAVDCHHTGSKVNGSKTRGSRYLKSEAAVAASKPASSAPGIYMLAEEDSYSGSSNEDDDRSRSSSSSGSEDDGDGGLGLFSSKVSSKMPSKSSKSAKSSAIRARPATVPLPAVKSDYAEEDDNNDFPDLPPVSDIFKKLY